MRRAIVVFSKKTDLLWLRLLLSRSFRHCYIMIEDEHGWTAIDALAHQTEVSRIERLPAEALAKFQEHIGNQAIITTIREAPQKQAPFSLFTCVENTKRILGIHNRSIITPQQLFNYLKKEPIHG